MHSIRFTIGLILLNLTIVACSNPDKQNCEQIIDEYEECLESGLNSASPTASSIGGTFCAKNTELSVNAIENNTYKEKLKRFFRNIATLTITQCFNEEEAQQKTTPTARQLQQKLECIIEQSKQKRKGVCS